MRSVVSCLCLLCLPLLAWAELHVCGDATQLQRAFNADPTCPTCPGGATPDPTCFTVPLNFTAVQRTLLETTPQRYLKVVNGLAFEKTPEEKAAVDAQIAADQAQHQAYVTEATQNDFCNTLDLDTLSARTTAIRAEVQTAISAMTNIATAQQAMNLLNNRTWTAFEKLGRCFIALRGARQ